MNIEKIKNELIKNYKPSTIGIDRLKLIVAENNIKKANEYDNVRYDEFSSAVEKLIENGVILPIGFDAKRGKQKKNTTNAMGFPLKYKIIRDSEEEMPQEFIDEIKWLQGMDFTKPIFKNPALYRKYREEINIISDYYKTHKTNEIISLNERSYELFNDEKFLSDQRRDKYKNKIQKNKVEILKKLGMTEDNLHCKSSYEPLLVFASNSYYAKCSRRILIIENQDTYWTFQRLIFKDKTINDIDMLIFGAGNKITGGFNSYPQYEITEKDEILYFGDIDSKGFEIFLSLKDKFPMLNINMYTKLYELLIDCTLNKNHKENEQVILPKDKLLVILENFNSEIHKGIIKKLIFERRYIPQEGLNYVMLKERWPANHAG